MQRLPLRHPSSYWAPLCAGCLYFLFAALALSSSRFGGGLAFISGANALLMAELLTTRVSYWPRVILTCAVASAAATALFGMGTAAALPMAVINMLEPLIVAIIFRRFAPGAMISGSMRALALFLFALCVPANIIAGLGAALVASLTTPVPFGLSWMQWYSGHVLGGLILTPILMMILQGEVSRWLREMDVRDRLETAGLLVLFALVTYYVFFNASSPMTFLPLLPLVVIAFRAGRQGAAAAILVLAVIGGASMMAGQGPFNMVPESVGERAQLFQLYLAMSFLISMPIAAELNSRRILFRMLQDSEARYRVIAELSGDLVLNLSVDGIINYASPSAELQLGCPAALLSGRSAAELIDPLDRASVIATHLRALAQPDGMHKVEFRPVATISTARWCEMVMRTVVDAHGMPTGVIGTIRDISRHKARQQALQQVASRDALTGADSRRAFLEKLADAAGRAGQGHSTCLLLIDIDYFKTINDRYGHGAGDRVLAGFVERLQRGLRSQDSVGRLGGEEFAVLMPDMDVERATLICERLRRVVAEPMLVGAKDPIGVTFSAGLVALHPGVSAETSLEAADKALYRAKHSGRNCLRLAA